MDLKTCVVHHAFRNLIGVALCHQILHDVLKHYIDIPVPLFLILGFLVGRAGILLLRADKVHGFQLCQCIVILASGDGRGQLGNQLSFFGKFYHTIQNHPSPVLGILREDHGIKLIGVLRDTGDESAFRQAALPDILIEIIVCRRFHALALAAVVYHIQVSFQNFLLAVAHPLGAVAGGIAALQIQGGKNFLYLSKNADLVFLRDIFDQLLGQGRAAASPRVGKELVHRPQGAFPVHALVLAEAMILNGDLGGLHVLRNLAQVDPHPVLVAVKRHVFRGLPVFVIQINKAGIIQLHGGNIGRLHIAEAQYKRQHR